MKIDESLRSESVRRIASYDLRDWMTLPRLGVALLALVGAVILDTTFVAVLHVDPSYEVATAAYVQQLGDRFSILLPLFAVLVGYSAVASERESGQLRMYMSSPHSRGDVYAGRLLSRSLWVLLVVAIAVGLVWLVSILLWSLDFGTLVAFSSATVTLVAAFLGLAIALSSIASTGKRALLALFAVIAFFHFGWQFVAVFVELLGWSKASSLVAVVDPMTAYRQLIDASTGRMVADSVLFGSVCSLLGWLFVPVWVGLHRFQMSEV